MAPHAPTAVIAVLQVDNADRVLSVQFSWEGQDKPVTTLFIGTSPEFELALYTLCFLAGGSLLVCPAGHFASVLMVKPQAHIFLYAEDHITSCRCSLLAVHEVGQHSVVKQSTVINYLLLTTAVPQVLSAMLSR